MANRKSVAIFLYARKIVTVLARGIPWVWQSRFRVCRCCERSSFFISFGRGDERKRCIRCWANLRYELLAQAIQTCEFDPNMTVIVEFDPNSPLRRGLARNQHYTRTYYSRDKVLGSLRPDGARCEDITALSFSDASIDMMISSEVLEHVPDLRAAFKETTRVLKNGGVHLFTVPTRAATRQRALLETSGGIRFLDQPEIHSDPLNPRGIPVFWDIGPDLASALSLQKLRIEVVAGPEGVDQRKVWAARKSEIA